MRTKKEVYNLISDLNDEAHSLAWDTWVRSDNLMNSENEDDWTRAEEVKEQASEEQARYFREMLGRHPGLLEEAKKYAEQDEDFNMDWEAWYQPYLDEEK
ncbi:hypothetical protein N9E52_02515 [Alphaproteobacteria bacterium]|nr:hypothetical protein [Alphaproteobacteria bacterium]